MPQDQGMWLSQILYVVMPDVVEEPGKCEICLFLQAGSLQSLTYQTLTEVHSGTSPSTGLIRWYTYPSAPWTHHWVAFTRKALFFQMWNWVLIYLLHFIDYFLESNHIPFSWLELLQLWIYFNFFPRCSLFLSQFLDWFLFRDIIGKENWEKEYFIVVHE